MVIAALILLIIAAVSGLVMLSLILFRIKPFRTAIFIHGTATLGAFTLFSIQILSSDPDPKTGYILMILAILTGSPVVIRQMMRKRTPRWLPIVHAMTGFSAIIAMLFFSMGHWL